MTERVGLRARHFLPLEESAHYVPYVMARNCSRRTLLAAALAMGASFTLGCEGSQPRDTPDGAVRELFSRLRGFRGADNDARALFELLSERARTNLEARAKRYGAASGKQIEPWAMLVPSRMLPRFQPQSYKAQIVGKYAMVDITGVSADEHAQVPCVLEDGVWRVDLVLPELPAAQKRPGAE